MTNNPYSLIIITYFELRIHLCTITGKSGIKVSIPGMGEPELTSFGELYANFKYSGNGGSMEVTFFFRDVQSFVLSSNDIYKYFIDKE